MTGNFAQLHRQAEEAQRTGSTTQSFGYPRYAALLSGHSSFHNFRRFTRVRMRLLLVKQDEISRLEAKLDSLDASESRIMFLGCLRLDANPERAEVMESLKNSLGEYDGMLAQSRQTLSMPRSRPREVQNLKNWTEGTGCLSRHETAYLDAEDDLANLTGSADLAIAFSESVVEDCLFWLNHWIGKYCSAVHRIDDQVSREDHLLLLGPRLQRLSRVLAIMMATTVILVPTVVLPSISSFVGRILASVVSAAIFSLVISFLTEARTVDIFASGASYAAVLVALTLGPFPHA